VLSVAEFEVNIEQTHDIKHSKRLAIPLAITDIIEMIFSEITNKRYKSKAIWLEGSLVISPIHIRIIYRTLIIIKSFLKKLFK
jgi:hypothetical protein